MNIDGWIGNQLLDHLSEPLRHTPTVPLFSSESRTFVNPEPLFLWSEAAFSEGDAQVEAYLDSETMVILDQDRCYGLFPLFN